MLRPHDDPAALDKLRARIQALRSKTVDNGCTEQEALAAAAKVAALLDQHDLSLSDVAMREVACVRAVFVPAHRKRIPIGDCVEAVARFCDCRVWRDRGVAKEAHYVFFGLPADAEAALTLAILIDAAVRAETGRYKTSPAYAQMRHQERHLANASFALGMVASIAEALIGMKAARDRANARSGRDLVVVKTSIVDTDLRALGIELRAADGRGRLVSPEAFAAGETAGGTFGAGGLAGAVARRPKTGL